MHWANNVKYEMIPNKKWILQFACSPWFFANAINVIHSGQNQFCICAAAIENFEESVSRESSCICCVFAWLGPNYSFFIGNHSYLKFLALESTQGPEGAPDGQDLTISDPNVVLGGQGLFLIIRFSFHLIFNPFCSRINPKDRGCPC